MENQYPALVPTQEKSLAPLPSQFGSHSIMVSLDQPNLTRLQLSQYHKQQLTLTKDNLKEYMDIFAHFMQIDAAGGKASTNTIRIYYTQVTQYFSWLSLQFSGLDVTKATKEHIQLYRHWLANTYAPATVVNKLSVVRRFYDALVNYGKIAQNPVAGIYAKRKANNNAIATRYYTWDKIQVLFALTNNIEYPLIRTRDRVVLSLMACHGLRNFEVATLKISDYSKTFGTLTVLGKGEKLRTIYLNDDAKKMIEEYLVFRTSVKKNVEYLIISEYVSAGKYGISCNGLRKLVNRYLAKLGIKRKGLSCHSLRHSFATNSLNLGADLMALSDSLGHSSVETTQIYAKIIDRKAKNPANLLVLGVSEDQNNGEKAFR